MSGMDQPTSQAGAGSDAPPPPPGRAPVGRKRSSSGASGLLSKLPFMRSTGEHRPRSRRNTLETDSAAPAPSLPVPSFITIPADPSQRPVAAAATAPPQPSPPHIPQHQAHQALQTAQQKTRRRRGSLRKVALLGRGVQRERRDGRALTIDTRLDVLGPHATPIEIVPAAAGASASSPVSRNGAGMASSTPKAKGGAVPSGLGLSDLTPRPNANGHASRCGTSISDPDATPTAALAPTAVNATAAPRKPAIDTSPSISYSTTDDEDALHMARTSAMPNALPRTSTPSLSLSSSSAASLLRPERASLSSGSESYFLALPPGGGGNTLGALPSIQRRRSPTQRAKSPLALTSLAAPLPQADTDWDYAETEWWGWIILLVTWTVFVVGMGSCLGVWSWAWDVGTTPYAPPELEDDPTLPIVGYYPALMILTGVMAWVWVVVAWVGMKYFRHAQVSGD